MEKSKSNPKALTNAERRNYWGIMDKNKNIIFEGTHSACWDELPKLFGNISVQSLFDKGYRLTRIS